MEWLTSVALNKFFRTMLSSQSILRLTLTTICPWPLAMLKIISYRLHQQQQFVFSLNSINSMVDGHAQQIVSYIKKYEHAAEQPIRNTKAYFAVGEHSYSSPPTVKVLFCFSTVSLFAVVVNQLSGLFFVCTHNSLLVARSVG